MQPTHQVAIIGENPEALFLSVLFADAGIGNYLVGRFGDEERTYTKNAGIDEALWLLGVLRKSGKVQLLSDYHQLPLSQIRTLILSNHTSSQECSNSLELVARNLARHLVSGTNVAFAGLCRPHYVESTLVPTLEKHAGLSVGKELPLYYLPLFWNGEGLQEFREKPKILAQFLHPDSRHFQEELFRVFPTLSLASDLELAEASGLFSTISREVSRALSLELAKISEKSGVNYEDVLDLSKDSQLCRLEQSIALPGRESIGTNIALLDSQGKNGFKLLRSAHGINREYQTQVIGMVQKALNRCGYPVRRSRIAILGTQGLSGNSWTRPQVPPIVQALSKKGARVSLYPGEVGAQPWTGIVGDRARVETNLSHAISKANCALVALSRLQSSVLDADQFATEMSRPAAICDLTGVLEASNVEKAGLFYTTLGRGSLDG